MTFDYDLFVIGGGSGGVRAARIAAAEGKARVGLAEEFRMGGTCVIRGCVPKKLMVYASVYPGLVADARAYGWDASCGAFDWPRFQHQLNTELSRLEAAYRGTLRGAEVTVHDARATVTDAHTVALSTGIHVTARHILIATGGTPFKPAIPGADLGITSNEIFNLPALPARLLIIGGGYIASEFACILNGLGCKVTQVYRGAQILRGFDEECRTHITTEMQHSGVDIRCNLDVTELEQGEGCITAHLSDGTRLQADQVLFATGRTPNTAGLGLEALGVTLAANGAVQVDDYSQTAVPSIFAVGDVTDRITLTPVAIREGHAFADTLFNARATKPDHALVASAVFTQPEFGTIGLTEEQASAQEDVDIYTARFRPMQTLFAGHETRALFKLVVSVATGKVLGCHIVAPGAGEMIQLAAIAIKMGATKADFDRTVAVHPTMSEELVTMRAPTRRVSLA